MKKYEIKDNGFNYRYNILESSIDPKILGNLKRVECERHDGWLETFAYKGNVLGFRYRGNPDKSIENFTYREATRAIADKFNLTEDEMNCIGHDGSNMLYDGINDTFMFDMVLWLDEANTYYHVAVFAKIDNDFNISLDGISVSDVLEDYPNETDCIYSRISRTKDISNFHSVKLMPIGPSQSNVKNYLDRSYC